MRGMMSQYGVHVCVSDRESERENHADDDKLAAASCERNMAAC